MPRNSRHGAVLLVDVASSSDVEDFAKERDKRIRRLSKRHLADDSIAVSYTITAWDEFQTVLWDLSRLPRVLLDIRGAFAPWEVYAAVGWGPVLGWRSRRPINEALSGPGFVRAREAMQHVKSSTDEKYRRLTRFDSGEPDADALINLIYGLLDTLVQQTTERQWETIRAAIEEESQERAARRLRIQPSTVTRNLKRGHYWQMLETAEVLSGQLARLIARNQTTLKNCTDT